MPTADKIRFIDALVASGIRAIEITSFVSPKWIPQLADAAEVARGVQRPPGVRMSALVPNRRGLDTALASGMKEIAVFLSASETHNKKNVNKTIAETLAAFDEVDSASRAPRTSPVRAYVSTVFGCPYEGDVDPERAVELVGQLRDMGVYQVSLGDTIGVANPRQVEDVLGRVLAKHPADAIAVHFHDTQGTALANCLVVAADGHHDDRRVGRRARRLSVRAGRVGQPRDRGRRRDAALDGRQDRHRSRQADRGVAHGVDVRRSRAAVEVPQGAPRQAGARAPPRREARLA